MTNARIRICMYLNIKKSRHMSHFVMPRLIYVITLYCIYGMFLIDDGTPDLFKSLFDLAKLFIKALLSR